MRVQVEIDMLDLHKLDHYDIVAEDIELRDFFSGCGDFGDLSNYEQEEIIECAKKAINKGWGYGIIMDVELGRSPVTDLRTYDLHDVQVCHKDDADCTVSEMVNYIAKVDLEYEQLRLKKAGGEKCTT